MIAYAWYTGRGWLVEMMAEAGEYDGMVIDCNADDTGDLPEDDGAPFPGEEIEF